MIILLDTNIFIDHLRNIEAATAYLLSCLDGGVETWVSSMTAMELFAAPEISPKQHEDIQKVLNAMSGIVSVDEEIAYVAGRLLAKYRKDNGLNPIDALIAATAITMDAPLVTRNNKHFNFIDGLVTTSPY